MAEEEGEKKKTTYTTTTTTTTIGVPTGAAVDGVVELPKGMTIAILTLDAVALFCWILTFAIQFFGIIGFICAMVGGSMASCCLTAESAGEKIKHRIRQVKISHIAFLVMYFLSFLFTLIAVITFTAGGTTVPGQATATGFALVALIFAIVNFVTLIVALVFVSILLCDINKAS